MKMYEAEQPCALFIVVGVIFIYIISFICCQARMAQIYEMLEELDLRKRRREENIFDKK